MAAFEYQALDSGGKTVKGVITGDSAAFVRQDLRDKGLIPISVESVSESGNTQGESTSAANKNRKTHIKTNDLSIITRQMATLLGSGLTVEETLSAMIRQSEGNKLKGLMSDIRALVTEGYSLSDAISLYPRSFPEIYRSSILAGEQSGNLDEVLERLADYLETRHGIQQRLKEAMVYPIFLISFCVLIVVGLVTFVVPKVVKVFEDTGQELPFLTQMVIGLSEFLQNYGLVLLIAIVGLVIFANRFFQRPKAKYWLHNQYLVFPGVRRLTRNINTARMARTLAIMIGSRVPLLTAMRSAEGVLTNVVMKKNLKHAAEEVSQGIAISRALDKSGNYSPLLIQMVASGENSGKLDHMLEKAASATEREVESRINMLVGILGPGMILIMGVAVTVIVLAILMPIFDLQQFVG